MWKHSTIEAFLGFLRSHVSTFLSPLIKVNGHILPLLTSLFHQNCRHLPSSSYPVWNILGPTHAYAIQGRGAESWRFGALLNQILCLSFCVYVLLYHNEQQSLIVRRKQEVGGRIAANVIPLQEYFLTHSACSHPVGKVWEISEGGRWRANLMSLCNTASANCRWERRV